MSSNPNDLPRGFARLRRTWVRFGVASGVLALLGVGGIAVLLAEPKPAAPQSDVAAGTNDAPAPARDDTPPPADRPTLDAPAGMSLSPVAARWRRAVILGRRDQVMQGALALRQAPDGERQLLSLARDRNARIRAYAFRELGRRKNPHLTRVFEQALADASPYVQENARWALGELKRKGR